MVFKRSFVYISCRPHSRTNLVEEVGAILANPSHQLCISTRVEVHVMCNIVNSTWKQEKCVNNLYGAACCTFHAREWWIYSFRATGIFGTSTWRAIIYGTRVYKAIFMDSLCTASSHVYRASQMLVCIMHVVYVHRANMHMPECAQDQHGDTKKYTQYHEEQDETTVIRHYIN